MTRGDELPRHMIPESEWPRFLQATVAEWAAILDTSAVTIISGCSKRHTQAFVPTESFLRDMFIVRSLEKVLEQRQKPSVGGVFLVIVIQTCDSLKDLLQQHTFLFVAAVLQREVTLGDLKSAFMQSDKDLSERPQSQLYASLPLWMHPSC